MVEKRHSRDHDGDGGDFELPHRDSKRRASFRTFVGNLTRGLPLNESQWETFFRRVVRDEVERAVFRAFNASPSHSAHQPGPSGGGSGLQLRFVNKLPHTIFTGSRIEAEDPNSILQIVLIDTVSQTIVNAGPLSSIKVEIVALNGEFGSDEQEDWSEKQFNDSILREREGRRPLVTGELTVMLKEGVGSVHNVVFTDNSSWIRSRKFRLGARIVQKITTEVRIREARSEPFVVKDHRGELYKKHYPPRLNDQVWRLEKIAKGGAFHTRLADNRITTVKGFLQLYIRDAQALREILGGLSSRTWNAIVEHAMSCVVDDNRFYAYHRLEHDVIVMFNSIYKVVGATFNGQFVPLDAFNPSQKVLVDNLKQHAYSNVNNLVPVDGPSIPGPLRSLAEPLTDISPAPRHSFQLAHQDQPVIQLGPCQATTSLATYPSGSEVNHQMVVSTQPDHPPFFNWPQTHRNSFSLDDIFPAHLTGEPSTSGSQIPIIPINHLSPENLFHYQSSNIPTAWNEQATGFCFATNDGEAAEAGFGIPGFAHRSRDRKCKARWCKIRDAIKFWFSDKLTAGKMTSSPLFLGY